MSEEELRFVGDKLFAYTPLPQYGDGIYKVQLVMTMAIHQKIDIEKNFYALKLSGSRVTDRND